MRVSSTMVVRPRCSGMQTACAVSPSGTAAKKLALLSMVAVRPLLTYYRIEQERQYVSGRYFSNNMLELDENIAIRACDWCGQQFYQGRSNHRFCCVEHGRKFHMVERRAALALFRAVSVMSLEEEEDERRRMAR
jgi:hypothetical protein